MSLEREYDPEMRKSRPEPDDTGVDWSLSG
jgi:hypothetical protein